MNEAKVSRHHVLKVSGYEDTPHIHLDLVTGFGVSREHIMGSRLEREGEKEEHEIEQVFATNGSTHRRYKEYRFKGNFSFSSEMYLGQWILMILQYKQLH